MNRISRPGGIGHSAIYLEQDLKHDIINRIFGTIIGILAALIVIGVLYNIIRRMKRNK